MSTVKKIYIVFLLIISSLIGIYFRPQQCFDGKILFCDEKLDSYIMDLKLNKMFEVNFEDYCTEFAKNVVLVQHVNGKSVLKIICKKGKENYVEVNKYVWGNPILIEDVIYFVATDSSDRYKNAFLYSYCNGEYNKILSQHIDSLSEIMYDDNNIYFVEKTNNYIVKKYSIKDGKLREIAKGRFPCWKERGKSMFFLTGKFWDKLTVIDFTSNTNIIVKDNINIVGSPKYDVTNNLLLFHWEDDKATGAGLQGRISVLDLNNMKKIDMSSWTRNVKINGKKIGWNSLWYNSIYCEWIPSETRTQGDGLR